MKRISCILILLVGGMVGAKAQTVLGNLTQQINFNLTNAIEISFVATGNSTGADVNLTFSTVNDYANGVESGDYQIRVRSNKDFDVVVETNDEYFTYAGSSSPAPQMRVRDVLKMKVTQNSTGGSIASGFSNFKALRDNDKKVINDGDRGGNQTFSVRYLATPGNTFPAGTYTIDVLYTATQD